MDIQSKTHFPLPNLMSVKQTAKVLGIAEKTLRDHVLYRRIKYIKIGGRVLFHPDDVAEFIKNNTVYPMELRPRNRTRSKKTADGTQITLVESRRSDSGKKQSR
jgi:excisionase family DNA binding protein